MVIWHEHFIAGGECFSFRDGQIRRGVTELCIGARKLTNNWQWSEKWMHGSDCVDLYQIKLKKIKFSFHSLFHLSMLFYGSKNLFSSWTELSQCSKCSQNLNSKSLVYSIRPIYSKRLHLDGSKNRTFKRELVFQFWIIIGLIAIRRNYSGAI